MLVHTVLFVSLILSGSAVAYAQQPNGSRAAVKTARIKPAAYPAGTKVNYVRTWTPNKPLTDPALVVSETNVRNVPQSTAYFDGLGRPLQAVTKGASPTVRDIVAPNVYDAFGRESFKYLPYVSTMGDGSFKLNPFMDQEIFYNSFLDTAKNNEESIYYGETQFEVSPLNRVAKDMAPGNNWAGSQRGVGSQYLVNAAADSVRIWNVSTTMTGNIPASTLTSPAAYAASQLFKQVTTDENGRQVVEYKDKEGTVILKKIQIAATPGTGHVGWLCTYYVYDVLRNLRFVLPPRAVELIMAAGWVPSANVKNSFCFRYEYDIRNRMVIKQIPGADPVEMVYDIRDRLVLSRDGNLWAVTGKWMATIYDELNRPTSTGIYTSALTHDALITAMSTTLSLPNLNGNIYTLTYTYYDALGYAGAKGVQSAYFTKPQAGTNLYAEPIVVSTQTKGLVTGTKVRVLDTEQFLVTTTHYDAKGRPVQVLSDNIHSGVDIVTNLYDFSGKTLSTYHYHNNPKAGTAGISKLLTNLTYDHAGRVTKVTKQLNDNAALKRDIATNTYDALGQLQRKEFRNAAGAVIESMDYTYNIRGWQKAINRKHVQGSEKHYFGQELHYDEGFTNKEYSGNIAGVAWRGTKITTGSAPTPNAYGYSYDAANRLLKGYFTQATSGLTFGRTAAIYDAIMGDGANPSTAYDANGNILKMTHMGRKGTREGVPIDVLTYSYDSSKIPGNKLYNVSDAGNNDATAGLGDFINQSVAATPEYRYDRNGNMIKDDNKKISAIVYNILNLPQTINVTGKGTIKYVYDASGRKLAKIVTDQTVAPVKTTRTDYMGPLIYQNDTLQLISHEEGRIRPLVAGGFTYDYFMKDHLGNVRIVLAEANPPRQLYMASMEPEKAAVENATFSNIDVTRAKKPVGYPENNQADKNAFVAKLNGKDADHRIGPGLVLKVKSGDTVRLGAQAFYKSQDLEKAQKTTAPAADMAASLIRVFGSHRAATAYGHGGSMASNGASFKNNFINGSWNRMNGRSPKFPDKPNRPKAYLNFVLFDEDFNLVEGSSGVKQVAAQPDELQTLAQDNIVMEKSGFLYVYTSNETQQDVFFDNVTVALTGTPVLEETHYYPFGLTIAGLSEKEVAGIENRFKFNGIELNRDINLNLYETQYRNLDPQIGRWWQIDPKPSDGISPYAAMDLNPIRYCDILGDTVRPGAGFFANAWEGVKQGGRSTLQFVKSLGTFEGAGSFLYSGTPLGMVEGGVGMLKGAGDYISDIPNKTADDAGHDVGFVLEKLGEIYISKKFAGAAKGSVSTATPSSNEVAVATESLTIDAASQRGLNLFKFGTPETTTTSGWQLGDRMLKMYDKGSPSLNWRQNSGFLRREMKSGKPIFDSYRTLNGQQIPTRGFLNAERKLLENRNWGFDPATGAYHPPAN